MLRDFSVRNKSNGWVEVTAQLAPATNNGLHVGMPVARALCHQGVFRDKALDGCCAAVRIIDKELCVVFSLALVDVAQITERVEMAQRVVSDALTRAEEIRNIMVAYRELDAGKGE